MEPVRITLTEHRALSPIVPRTRRSCHRRHVVPMITGSAPTGSARRRAARPRRGARAGSTCAQERRGVQSMSCSRRRRPHVDAAGAMIAGRHGPRGAAVPPGTTRTPSTAKRRQEVSLSRRERPRGSGACRADPGMLCHPAVDTPAVPGGSAAPCRARALQELVEHGARLVAERLRGQGVVALDLGGQVLAHAHETSSSSLSAARMASRVLSFGGHMGRRKLSSQSPIRASPALTGMGFDSTKFRFIRCSSR